MKTIKINDYDKLISHAGIIVSNNQGDISRMNLTEALPKLPGLGYQQLLPRYERLVDSAANLANPRDRLVAQSLSAVGQDYFTNLADLNAMLLVNQVAQNMALGQVFDNVKFEVSDEVMQRISHEKGMISSETAVLNREAFKCVAAMDSVVNGVDFSMDEYYDAIMADNQPDIPEDIYEVDDELTEEIDLDENELGEPEDLDEFAKALREARIDDASIDSLVSRMSEKTGDGFADLTTAESFNQFTGERQYTSATFRINMSDAVGMTMDNYQQRLGMNVSAEDKQWCVNSVNGMLRSLYGDEKYEAMVRDGADMFAGIFIDGKPASMMYEGDNNYSNKCTALMKEVLDGGHRLNISPLEKGADGKYSLSETICDVNVQPSLEAQEEFSLWKAILRFFGIHIKTRAEKMADRVSFAELENQDAVEKIRAFGERNSDYSRRIQPLLEAREENKRLFDNVEEYAFASNINDPDTYFISAANYSEFVPVSNDYPNGLDTFSAVKTLGRMPSRGSLAIMYMLSEGMTIEQMLNPTDADKERMKALGKEFTDTMTMPESPLETVRREHPDYTKEQIVTELQNPELRERYKSACEVQVERITAMYQKMDTALRQFESQLPAVDINNTESLAATYTRYAVYSTASCDMIQSLESPVMKGEAVKDRTMPIMDRACDNQYKHSVRDIVKAMTAPELTESTINDPTALYGRIAGGLVNKQYEMNLAGGMEPSTLNHTMLNIMKLPLSEEIATAAKSDPAALSYAKDILSGKAPMPEGMISQQGVRFIQCYQQHKQLNAPSLQMDRSVQK